MAAFADLPMEVRDMIYNCCLISKYKICATAEKHELKKGVTPYSKSKEELDLALLTVNRSIGSEAADFFYGQNTFHLAQDDDEFQDNTLRHHVHQIRHVSISFHKSDVSAEQALGAVMKACHEFNEDLIDPHFDAPKDALLDRIHDSRHQELFENWEEKAKVIFEMQLQSLEIDVSSMFCHSSYCDLRTYLWGEGPECDPYVSEDFLPTYLHRHDTSIKCHSCRITYRKQREIKGLADMQITITGMENEAHSKYLHELGFGCLKCPREGKTMTVRACAKAKGDKGKDD